MKSNTDNLVRKSVYFERCTLDALRVLKKPSESFSLTIDRLIKRVMIMDGVVL